MTPPFTAGSIQQSVLLLISTYGLLAVFVYMALETSLLLHFVPSEVVIPFAAALLVTDPVSFVVFVLVATAGATAGSVIAYYVFGRNSTRVLERYGRYVSVSQVDIDRWERWFRRWGETSVFWGRLLPVIRGLISVPAGAAEMDLRRFVVLSAAGAFVFNAALTYLVYVGKQSGTFVRRLLATFVDTAFVNVAYIRTHLGIVLVEVIIGVGIAVYLWRNRVWIREHPELAKRRVLRVVRACGLLVGLLLISSAFSVPDQAFAAITWVWNDPLVLTVLGLSPLQSLVVLGSLIVLATLLVTAVGTRISVLGLSERIRPR